MITVNPSMAPSRDLRVLWLALVPAALIIILLFATGLERVGLGVGVTVFVLASVIAPEIGFYGYFAWQALDPMSIVEETTVLTPGKILGLFLILNYLVGVWRNRTPILISRRFILIMLAFGLLGILMIPLAVNPWYAFRNAAQIIIQIILIIVAIHTFRTRETIGRAVLFLVIGGVIASLIILMEGGQFGGSRRATLSRYANPNTTALGLSLAVMCIPAAWSCVKSKWYIPFHLVSAPIMIAATMQTGSRSALGAILFASILGGLLATGVGTIRRLAIPLVCIVIAVATGAFVLSSHIEDRAGLERIESLFYDRGSLQTESRWYIWGMVIRTYLREPWGFGFGNTQFKMVEVHGMPFDVHSTFLSTLVDGGPIALGLFLYGFLLLTKYVMRIRKANPGIAAMMLLCFVGFSSLTHTIHFTKWFWIPVTLCLLLAELAQRERLEQIPAGESALSRLPTKYATNMARSNDPH